MPPLRKHHVVSTLGLEPEPSSHDWHVQPSCQRPNRGPPERRAFQSRAENAVRGLDARSHTPACPRNRSRYPFRRCLSTRCAHRISTVWACGVHGLGPRTPTAHPQGLKPSLYGLPVARLKPCPSQDCLWQALNAASSAQQNGLPHSKPMPFSARAEAEVSGLEKDRLEVLAKTA